MKYVKILNLFRYGQGTADYKGLDLNKIEAGSQLYPETENIAYIATTQTEIPVHEDLVIITEEEYKSKKPIPQPLMPTTEERLSAIEDLLITLI